MIARERSSSAFSAGRICLAAFLVSVCPALPRAQAETVEIDSYKQTEELMSSDYAGQLDGFSGEQDKSFGSAAKRGLAQYEKCLLGLFYQAETLDSASVVNGYPAQVYHDPVMTAVVNISLRRKYGVTIGREMYFPPGELSTRGVSGMTWLAHEMKHVAQARAFGAPQDFLQAYTSVMAKGILSGQNPNDAYWNMAFETDARTVAAAFTSLLNQEQPLADALSAPDPDKEVCGLVGANQAAYRSRINGALDGKERASYKFHIGSFPFMMLKTVTYTFYKE